MEENLPGLIESSRVDFTFFLPGKILSFSLHGEKPSRVDMVSHFIVCLSTRITFYFGIGLTYNRDTIRLLLHESNVVIRNPLFSYEIENIHFSIRRSLI